MLFVGVLSEAVIYESEDVSWAFSLSSAVRYGAEVVDDLGAGNRDDLGRVPGIERTREVVLEPVGISGIRPRREGVRGVAYERLVSLVWLEELPPLPGDPPTWLSPKRLLESGPRKAKRGNAVVPSNFGVPTLEILGAGEETIEPYSSTVDESSAASLCRSCSLTLDSEYTELALPGRTRRVGPSSSGL